MDNDAKGGGTNKRSRSHDLESQETAPAPELPVDTHSPGAVRNVGGGYPKLADPKHQDGNLAGPRRRDPTPVKDAKPAKDLKLSKNLKPPKDTTTNPGKAASPANLFKTTRGKETKSQRVAKDGKPGEPKRRKTKAEPKPKTKAPVRVDLDKHCGVMLTNAEGQPTGSVCLRSLSCKTHSMGAKRAVAGRSKSFDALFIAYQQRNSLRNATTAFNNEQKKQQDLDAEAETEPPLSNADEVTAVVRGALHATPVPLDKKILVSSRLRGSTLTLRELLYKSVTVAPPPPVATGPPLAAVMASTDAMLGRCILFNPLTNYQSVRPSQVHANLAMQRALRDRAREGAPK